MSDKGSQFLTVNSETSSISPLQRKRHITRKGRALSPDVRAPSPAGSYDEALLRIASASSIDDLRPKSASSFYNLNRTGSSDSLRKHHKSIDNLCFARKKLHRHTHVNEIYRPRCYTDPGFKEEKPLRPLNIPILRIPEDESGVNYDLEELASSPSETTNSSPVDETKRSVLGSLLKQTIKVTTASMGFRALSMERLAPSTVRPLSEDVKRRFSR